MAVVDKRDPRDAEMARVWVGCRSSVLRLIERRFPVAGSVAVESAVDQPPRFSYGSGSRKPNLGRFDSVLLPAIYGVCG
jgi:hypothetical protein